MPCAPGGRAVPSVPRLVTVVAGKPAVSGLELNASSARNGAAAWCARNSSQPSPSTMSRQARHVPGAVAGERGEDGGGQVGETALAVGGHDRAGSRLACHVSAAGAGGRGGERA